MTEAVVLINSFEVPPADAEQFIAAWEKTLASYRPHPALYRPVRK